MTADAHKGINAALQAYLDSDHSSENGHSEERSHGLRTAAALGIGAAVLAGGRMVFLKLKN